MRALLFIIVLGPVSVYACAVLCMEFREEIVTGFNGITYKTESKKARELIELEFPSVICNSPRRKYEPGNCATSDK